DQAEILIAISGSPTSLTSSRDRIRSSRAICAEAVTGTGSAGLRAETSSRKLFSPRRSQRPAHDRARSTERIFGPRNRGTRHGAANRRRNLARSAERLDRTKCKGAFHQQLHPSRPPNRVDAAQDATDDRRHDVTSVTCGGRVLQK